MKPKFRAVLFPKPYSNGEFPLFIQIYFQAKRSYISTGYSIPAGAWNEDSAEVWESMPSLTKRRKENLKEDEIKLFKEKQKSILLLPSATKINSDIREITSKLEEILKGLEVNKQEISAESLKRHYENKDTNENARKDFIQYIQLVATKKFQNRQIRTAEKYEVLMRKLKDFRNNKPLPVEELSTRLLNEFQLYLVKNNCHINYIYVHLKALKTIIQKEAIKIDRILSADKNPFLFFEMPKVIPTVKEKLDIIEIERLEDLEYSPLDKNFHIKNAFLFSLYTAGIRIGDLLLLKWSNIKEGRLVYNMGKTGKSRSIKLLPQALKTLDYYKSIKERDTDFIFPFMDNNAEYAKLINPEDFQKASPELLALMFKKVESKIALCNAGLKEIAIKAKIKKKLQNHISRHSFADMARKKGTSIYDISKMLGHSDISVTQKYIQSIDIEAMDNAMEKVYKK